MRQAEINEGKYKFAIDLLNLNSIKLNNKLNHR